jgi:K+-transporting ATPase A subunit
MVQYILKFKDILTTIAGFFPLAALVIAEIEQWQGVDGVNVLALVAAVAFLVVSWFVGKRPA